MRRALVALLFLALFASLSPAYAAVRLPARFVPGDAAISAAAADQSAPSLAPGGGMVLALWSDNRANSTGGYEGETSRDIYGVRLDGNGALLDTVPIAITASRASQDFPRAAWNGTNWLVVFETYDLTGTGYYYQKALAAVRVAPDGRVLDPAPIRIFNATPTGSVWGVASDGVNWVVAIAGTATGGDIGVLRISAAGVLLDPNPKNLVPETYYLRGRINLAYAGGVFLLAYEEAMTGSSATSAIRFDSNLVALDAAPFTLLDQPIAALASSGAGFYAVWTQQLPDYTTAVFGSRIGTNGQKLDGAGVNISGANQPGGYAVAGVAWDGANWKATWGSLTATYLARVNPAGQVLDPGGIALAGLQTGPTAGAGNGTLQFTWTVSSISTNDVVTAHVPASNVAGPVRTVSLGVPAQTQTDLATNGNGFMLVYRSLTSARTRLVAQPLDAAGKPLTAEPVELDAASGESNLGTGAVAWNGSLYMAAWVNSNTVYARRIRPDGTLVDAAPIAVMTSTFGPVDLDALGDAFLVVGLRCGYSCHYVSPFAARVRGSDGVVLDTTAILLGGGSYASSLRVAALGGRWLIAWQDNASHDDSYANTLATFIDASGVKSTTFNAHGPYSTAGGNGIFSLGLASNGSLALLVQSQELTSGVENDLLGRFINPDGSVQPMFNITPWAGNQYRPRVAWDGTNFVVVFQDQKARVTAYSLEQLDARSDLFGMRITPAGAILDPQGFVFSNSPAGEAYPNVASTGGVSLVAASIMRNASPLTAYRVGYDLFGTGSNPWPVAVASAAGGGEVPVTVNFSPAGSTDLGGGTITSYLWDFADGATSTEMAPAHVYSVGGPYVATLTVTDNGGARTMQEVLVQAVTPNVPPLAHASSDKTSGQAPLDVTFYARGSYDPDGWLGNIKWTFADDGSETWGATGYHTFYEAGTWLVTLTVYDASGATGTDTLTVTVSAEVPPAAPTNLKATAVTTTQVNLTWTDNASNERGYTIERCTGTAAACNANPSLFSFLDWAPVNGTTYSDYTVSPNTTYSYRVFAQGASVNSAYSNTAEVTTTPSSKPAAPSNLTTTAGLRSGRAYVDLRWKDNSGNETSFVIERCKGALCTNFALLAQVGANTTTYRDNNVARRTVYRYRVKARNGSGDSGYSNSSGTTTP